MSDMFLHLALWLLGTTIECYVPRNHTGHGLLFTTEPKEINSSIYNFIFVGGLEKVNIWDQKDGYYGVVMLYFVCIEILECTPSLLASAKHYWCGYADSTSTVNGRSHVKSCILQTHISDTNY